jgi:L-ribulose-5-phosphate 3-epimerase UlaE
LISLTTYDVYYNTEDSDDTKAEETKVSCGDVYIYGEICLN